MTTSILATKLFIPPIRAKYVPRSRLLDCLNKGLNRKLTLISAPAGFGKTTLVSEWVDNLRLAPANESQFENRIAWFSLDENDNDIARFLAYFIAAINQIDGIGDTFGKGALVMLQSPQPPPTELVLTSLINEISTIPDRMIFIIDDYHLIEAQSIHDALKFLLENIPPQMHLVIATRNDPQLPIARLRARDHLTELRAADLRFTSTEAAEFLNQVMGLDLSVENISTLETRTEGWIAGLQLAAISMQGQKDASILIKSFSGSHRLVLDYLIEEVLEQQSENVRFFLLQTAVLNRMTGFLCDALTGQDDGQATLEMLGRANMFIVPLDEERHWYRYHHLFSDLLRQRLRQTSPEQVLILHIKASEWNEHNGFIDEAIEHALIARDLERTAHLIENQFGDNYERANPTTLQRWLAEFPEEIVFSKPLLCIIQAWNQFTSGQLDAADLSLQAAEKMLGSNTDPEPVSSPDKDQLSDTYRMKLAGRIAVIRSFSAGFSGNIPVTIRYARQALEYLPEHDLTRRSAVYITLGDAYEIKGQIDAAHEARLNAQVTSKASGDIYLLMIINLRLAEILRQQGKLQQVIDICESYLKRADESGLSESVLAGWLFGIWGEALAELNYLDRALDKVKKGIELTAGSRDVVIESKSNLYLVRVLFSSGELTGAEKIIQSMENYAHEYDMSPLDLLQLSSWQVRIWLAQGNLKAASQWVRGRDLDPDGEFTYLLELEHIAYSRILIAQGSLDEATRLLQRLFDATEKRGLSSRMIEILLLQALSLQAQEKTDQAINSLQKALTLAEPEGFIRIFVDEGPAMARLLYETLKRDISPDYISQLLASFPVDELEKPDPSKPQTPKTKLVEPLSDREIEVLQLISDGLTNSEIGSRLYLSPNTVKSHARNIFAKIEVNNRTQASAKARALGLLKDT